MNKTSGPVITVGIVSAMLLAGLVSAAPSVRVDGKAIDLAPGSSVAHALRSAGVQLGPDDQVHPALDTLVEPHTEVTVSRVTYDEVSADEKIPYKTVIRPASPGLRPYHPTVIKEGAPGLKRTRYQVKLVDGREVSRIALNSEVVREAEAQVVVSRKPWSLGSRGAYTGLRSLTVVATAYDPGPGSCGKWADGKTCNGKRAGYGIIAVDPKVFPLGVKLQVPGYGIGVTADVGSAIKGNHIDLGFNSRSGARQWGKKWVKVSVLD